MNMARTTFLAFMLSWSCIAAAQVPVPLLTARVTDQTATLTTQQKATLEQTLRAFEAKKGSQIAVLIIATTAAETIEQYALRVVEQWKLGRKNVDDGVLLIIAKDDRVLRIEVGYGLEGALTDATSKRIISEIITPRFKQGDFYGGITAGIDRIIRVIDGEPLPKPTSEPAGDTADIQQYIPVIFIFSLVVGGILRIMLGRFRAALVTGGVVTFIAWLYAGTLFIALVAGVIALFFILFGGGSGMGGRGSHYGGSGRGGFSGGGGSFGGGGASGRW